MDYLSFFVLYVAICFGIIMPILIFAFLKLKSKYVRPMDEPRQHKSKRQKTIKRKVEYFYD